VDRISDVPSDCADVADSSLSDNESDFGPSMLMHRQKRPLVVSSSDSGHNEDINITSAI
jgi:hypothetical protein